MLTYPLCVWRERQETVLASLSSWAVEWIDSRHTRCTKPRGTNRATCPLFMELWGVVFGSHMCYTKPQKSANLTKQSGAKPALVVGRGPIAGLSRESHAHVGSCMLPCSQP